MFGALVRADHTVRYLVFASAEQVSVAIEQATQAAFGIRWGDALLNVDAAVPEFNDGFAGVRILPAVPLHRGSTWRQAGTQRRGPGKTNAGAFGPYR